MKGLFHSSELLSKAPLPILPRCGSCGLSKTCTSPKMPVDGDGEKKILIVGEAPGRVEDIQGKPLVGESGKLLASILRNLQIDMRNDCWLTNALICRPPGNKIGKLSRIGDCRPNVVRTIKELKPNTIILLGTTAVSSVIGWLWKEDPGSISRWIGWTIPDQQINSWICPTFHPSFILRGINSGKTNEVAERMFTAHLKKAVAFKRKPWKSVPNYDKEVKKLYKDEEIVHTLNEFTKLEVPIAFDYETDRLKPDNPDSKIICASVSNGITTVAFPWYGKAIEAMGRLLSSPVPKVGYNIKFEERWSIRTFGTGVNNWIWDGMLAAHTLDCRRGICGLKFQSYVQLGHPSYDDNIKPFMKSDNGNSPNKLMEGVYLDRLLLYCGVDSKLEWEMANKQMEEIQ